MNNMENETENINLKNDEVQDILSRPPHILIRCGILIIALAILTVLSVGLFYHYPDTIEGKVVITGSIPPVSIISPIDGRIEEILVSDNQSVIEKQALALLDNSASFTDVQIINKLLNNVIIADTQIYIPPQIYSRSYALGEIQESYSRFVDAIVAYKNFENLNLASQDQQIQEIEIRGKEKALIVMNTQINLSEDQLNIQSQEYNRNKELYQKGVISRSELELSEQDYLAVQQSLRQMQSQQLLKQTELLSLKTNIKKLKIGNEQEHSTRCNLLQNTYNELRSSIKVWDKKYILRASISGKITFNQIFIKNQNVKKGQETFLLAPSENRKWIGRMQISQQGSGKVLIGQKVNIKIDSYPYLEYGRIEGTVSKVSTLPDGENYTIEIKLPSPLLTTTGNNLPNKGIYRGKGSIVVSTSALLFRLCQELAF